ncbi:MAG: enoyl-CoA hydratase [Nocardia sp.]|uniref:crotonase/enoyl-CoA hydratase family protein n=1 Tax=Nocardia sp. TaxID=1821 RepID=UPI0026391893|nr:crotonase/enoyl-CoA hydratase family protein [Nocardia sp.]MCU1647701.1 enoyl-CoA hydratase [Nocardia sp.]
MTKTVLTERDGHTLVITLNRPDKRNAFDFDLLRGLSEAYTELAKDRELRVGVLRAEGKDFTSGLDLASLAPRLPLEVMATALRPLPIELVKGIVPHGGIDPFGVSTEPCPKPVVTAVQGRCYTLGIELMLSAQVNIASESAVFTQYEVARGLFPFGGGTVRWPQSVGLHNAYRYLLTGDEFDAAEAYRVGLVQQVTSDGGQFEAALAMAHKIGRQAPLGVAAILRNTRTAQTHGARAALRRIRPELVRILFSKDVRRGFAAFKNREPAEFFGD